MKPVRSGLQLKVLSGLALLTVVTVGSQLLNYQLYRTSVQRHTALGEVRQIETIGDALLGRGTHYVNNAARDYESYARDVALFKRDLLGDVERFGATLRSLERKLSAGGAAANDPLAQSVAALAGSWAEYRQDLDEKLGPDPNAPRLEWGAQFIADSQPAINGRVHTLVEAFQAASERDTRVARSTGVVTVTASIAIAVLAVAWFFFGVTRRIRDTVEGCQRVAAGDFGYQMPARSQDELGQLARAFNSLSSRARLVLSLLDHLQQRSDLATSFAELARDSAQYIPADWLGLIEVSDLGNDGTIRYAKSTGGQAVLAGQRVGLLGLFAQHRFFEATTVYLPDLRRHAVEHAESRLVRELVRTGYRSALLVPLNANRDWQALLLFASQHPDAYTPDQAKLMASLAPMLSNGLARNARKAAGPPLAEALAG